MRPSRERRPFVLDANALAIARASHVLAIDPRAWGSMMSLAAEAPTIARAGTSVAVISIEGPLSQRASDFFCGYGDGYDAIADRFREAAEDPNVGAIVLRIDSPGGDVAGCEESIRRMCAARDASGKPCFAYVDECAASAAYWIASNVATAGIFLPVAGVVGSIGVLAALVDESAALEQMGVKVELVRDPPGKAAGHPDDPVTDIARARMIETVRDVADRFFAAVSSARPKLTLDAIVALNGDVRHGQAAVAAGLADGVASLEDVLAKAAAAAKRPASAAAPKSTPAQPARTPSGRTTQPTRPARASAHLHTTTKPRSAAPTEKIAMADYQNLIDAAKACSAACAACAKECDAIVELAASGTPEEVSAAADSLMQTCAKADDAIDACMQECSNVSGTPVPSDDNPAQQGAVAELVRLTGKANATEALGVVAAWKDGVKQLAVLSTEVATLKKNAERDAAKALIDAAQRDNKVTPATRGKTEALYAKHGLAALQAHLDALVPVASAPTVAEPETKGRPAEDANKAPDASSAPSPAATHEKRRYEDMTASQRHDLRASGELGERTYQTLRADWLARGKPNPVKAA